MMADAEWIAMLNQKPEKGLSLLIDAYMGLVYAIVHGRLHTCACQEDIDECVSDTFLSFYNQRHRLRAEKGSVAALLAVMATRKAIDRYRALQPGLGKTVPLHDELPFHTAAEDAVMAQEERRHLIAAIQSLGEPDSEILIRKYFLCQSTKAIAADLALKENTVDKKISRGLEKLRRKMGGDGSGR